MTASYLNILNGFAQRWKGKVTGAHGFFGKVFVGQSEDMDAAVANSLVYAICSVYGAPTNGTSGTHAGLAPPGSLLVDVQNKVLYQNTNTQASPTWTALTTATGAGTYTGTFDGVVGGTTPAAATVTTLTTSGTFVDGSVADNLTAHAGGGQASALALTHDYNRITTVGTAADSVKLPASVAGKRVVIINDAAANAAQVFGAGTDTIDGVATGTGVVLSHAKRAVYWCVTAGAWQSLGGSPSA